MAWWVWALVAWSSAASVAVLWLAAEVSDLRSLELQESAAPLDLPWLSATSPDPLPPFQFGPKSIAAAAGAALARSGLGDQKLPWSMVRVCCGNTVATARRAICRIRGGGPAAIPPDELTFQGQMDKRR